MSNNAYRIPRPAVRVFTPLPAHRPSGRVPVAVRSAGGEPVETLFERLADLGAEPDALSAARLCVDVLARVIPCRALLAHAFDVVRGDFVVVHARGEHADTMVLERQPVNDPLLRIAMPTGEPFAWTDLRRAPVQKLSRFTALPHVKTIMTCPVVVGSRWLGAFELVDPFYGASFRTEDALAARYVANRYASFVLAHGIVLDIGAIARFANAHFASAHMEGGPTLR